MASKETGRRGRSSRAEPTSGVTLSEREREVLALVGQGHTNVRIAEALRLSRHTVARHIVNARSKLGATNRSQAAVMLQQLQASAGEGGRRDARKAKAPAVRAERPG